MLRLFFKTALLPAGWANDVRIAVDAGRIHSIATDTVASSGDERHAIGLAGMPNLHSHAFQRGLVGLTETRGRQSDSFWTWREQMYRFALTMTPDHVEAVAAQLYMEMLEAGFTRVGEFHYLHHDRDGRPYANIAEMGARIAAASAEAGIGLTLLPVLYAQGGFGGQPAQVQQRRFVNDLDGFAHLLDASRAAVGSLDDGRLGVAPHSLRATTPQQLRSLAALWPTGPVHIHVAEQVREVDDCVAWSGRRPVQWLLDEMQPDARWCFIHATHMTDSETRGMAAAGVVAGLCPITEANLGDGIFRAADFAAYKGAFGIGSDGNSLIGVADELRHLEYSQRLLHRARNVLAGAEGGSTGRALFEGAHSGGSVALDGDGRGLAVGAPADIVSLNAGNVVFSGLSGDNLLDAWMFSSRGDDIDCVWRSGVKHVIAGRHLRRDAIVRRFRAVMGELLA